MRQRYSWLGKPSHLILHLCSLFAEVSAKRMVDKERKGRKTKKKKKKKKKKRIKRKKNKIEKKEEN